MIDVTANRTLVKSPPELWTELSEVEGLGRHLGEFGEIRITKLEPETTVAWEGERASGTVELEPSGWGTKVTLTADVVVEEQVERVDPPEAPEGPPAGESGASGSERAEPVAVATSAVMPTAGSGAVQEPTPPPPPPRPEREGPPVARPSRSESGGTGFFGRLFRRPRRTEPPRPAWQPQPQRPAATVAAAGPRERPVDAAAMRPKGSVPVPEAAPPARSQEPERVAPEAAPPARSQEPERVAQALDSQRALAVLEGTLDALGAAHHRPFSRE